MIRVFKTITFTIARLRIFRNLVFISIVAMFGCGQKEATAISIIWNNNKATAITLPEGILRDVGADSLPSQLKVYLQNNADSTAILGDVKAGSTIMFEPLLPFSRGLNYTVFLKNKKIGEFTVPSADKKQAPELITSYPTLDTVPENLLKIYLAFSQSMSEGHSDKFITLIKNGSDTLHDVFLNLQPELWNEDRTVLTVWLDPGRIKRDLQPNLRLGAPLHNGDSYRLSVSHLWKDGQGVPLQKDFEKSFITGGRDSISPDPTLWKLKLPEANSENALEIILDEPVDHYLLNETLHIKNEQQEPVQVRMEIYNDDRNLRFIPTARWQPGSYSVIIESRLEDLAGNNLNRPFDRDITQGKTPPSAPVYERKFKIGD